MGDSKSNGGQQWWNYFFLMILYWVWGAGMLPTLDLRSGLHVIHGSPLRVYGPSSRRAQKDPGRPSTRRPAFVYLSGLSWGWMATEYQRVRKTAREIGDGACCQMELIMLLICVCLFVRVSRRRTSDGNTIQSCSWITLIAIQASYCRLLSRARI